ncbi:hypothetical protein M9Y10_032147 [Tritrichomonas musculus]|uniref:Uncharacterized protein n=1 Tax=Tritrichomonas musculus TaxID=1915356 RepID=A0ABR2GZ48_9EUKA
MEVQQKIDQMKQIYNLLITFLEDESNSSNNFIDFTNFINNEKIIDDKHEITDLLLLISNVSTNHHRSPNFTSKIEQILTHFESQIKSNYTSSELYEIFSTNMQILLFLFNKKLLMMNETIYNSLKDNKFFIPELNEYKKLHSTKIPDNFENKRRIGQNDDYLCTLIQNDLVEDFISYVHRSGVKLSITIKPSFFETNPFLINKTPSLIEYASFFGSKQIIMYMQYNGIELKPSLWLFAIHSNSADLIRFLESNHVKPDSEDEYITYFYEAIKCHHNNIANYILDYFIDSNKLYDITLTNYDSNFFNRAFQYRNYEFLPEDLHYKYYIFYLCQYRYYSLIKVFLNLKDLNINDRINDDISLKNLNVTPIRIAAQKNYFDVVNLLLTSKHIFVTNRSFAGCELLSEIDIPSHVSVIEEGAFDGCRSLERITLPSSLTKINDYTFRGCSSLKSLVIPNLVKSIGIRAFENCSSLTHLEIPESVTLIGEYSFSGCSSIEEIIIPEKVTLFERGLFDHCKSLKKMTLPPNSTEIREETFNQCSSLTDVSIPPTVTVFGPSAFRGCESLTDKSFVIPSNLSELRKSCFSGCSSLEKVNIPSSVTVIDENAFYGCSLLTEIEIPSKVTEIKRITFYNCSNLKKVTLSPGITKIEFGAFRKCFLLEEINIPPSVSSIGQYCFHECKSLKKISIPRAVEAINDNTFNGCSELEEIIFEEDSCLKRICCNSFRNCIKLTKLVLPPSILSIELNSFENCRNLRSVSVPSSFNLSSKCFPKISNISNY